ncbi:Hypothetical protein R9X50_00484600 [Acrodontium crateriforme]|uniref:ADF-H domain-containing protein n=1 Tax=Acrodontium crateriforme TaxID=150365 RepID=A0AAQ3M4Z5_9PEZI|nr:Hypothetical protein R9X50_00484600 [Acrodontium crateriforme]
MSLNGLDAADVKDAYESAIVEAGGWLLLHYVSRDSIALLARGTGGVHEARAAITKYTEVSPLYGLLIYRRRKVVIKYIPEGTSRLLQARTTVHFQDVTETFAPYETVLDIAFSEDLNDTALADSFPLFSATPAAAPNRLEEINEEAEDGGSPPSRIETWHEKSWSSASNGTSQFNAYAASQPNEDRAEQITPTTPVLVDIPPRSSSKYSPNKTSRSRFAGHESAEGSRSSFDNGAFNASIFESLGRKSSVTELEITRTASVASREITRPSSAVPRDKSLPLEPLHHEQTNPRSQSVFSSTTVEDASFLAENEDETKSEVPAQGENFSLDELSGPRLELPADDYDPYDYSKFEIKQKLKLGPRPVASLVRKKSGNSHSASVPSGYRSSPKKQEPIQQHSSHTLPPSKSLPSMPVPMPAAAPTSPSKFAVPLPASSYAVVPPPPPVPESVASQPISRPASRGSNRTGSNKSSAMTAEKLRLMKAVELRRRQLRKSKEESASAPSQASAHHDELEFTDTAVPSTQETQSGPQPAHEAFTDAPELTTSVKADSGVGMNCNQQEKHANELSATPNTDETAAQESAKNTLQLSTAPSTDSASAAAPLIPPPENTDESGKPRGVLENPLTPSKHGEPFVDSPTLGLQNGVSVAIASVLPSNNAQESSDRLIKDDHKLRPITPSATEDEALSGEADASACSSPDISFHSPPRDQDDLAKQRRRAGVIIALQSESESIEDEEFEDENNVAAGSSPEPKIMLTSGTPMKNRTPRQSTDSPVSPLSKSPEISGDVSPLIPAETPVDTSPEQASHAENSGILQKADSRNLVDPMIGRKVSAGISQRIKNLAEQSSREGSPHPFHNNRPLNQPSISSFSERLRKRTTRGPQSKDASPQLSIMSPEGLTMSVQRDPINNRDSVTVTARIARPRHQHTQSSPSDIPLYEPELTLNKDRASTSHGKLVELARKDGSMVSDSRPSSPPADSVPRASYSSLSQTLSRASKDFRNSEMINSGLFKLRKASLTPIDDDAPLASPDMVASGHPFMNWDAEPDFKEGTRTSRFFKRISNIGSSKRLSIKSGTRSPPSGSHMSINSDFSIGTHSGFMNIAEKTETPPELEIGNLNVQFPDSLLWKLRILRLDDAGNLVFSIPQALDIQKGVSKRYHLSEFKQPYTPDLDRQELPHSVMFDSVDGSTLQLACEDSMTHRLVLQTLRFYWKSWSTAAQ